MDFIECTLMTLCQLDPLPHSPHEKLSRLVCLAMWASTMRLSLCLIHYFSFYSLLNMSKVMKRLKDLGGKVEECEKNLLESAPFALPDGATRIASLERFAGR